MLMVVWKYSCGKIWCGSIALDNVEASSGEGCVAVLLILL